MGQSARPASDHAAPGDGVVAVTSGPGRVVAAALLCLVVHGCNQVDGGAVELSWKLRSRAGGFVDCVDTAVDRIQLTWTVDGEVGGASWACAENRAVTRFDVPTGAALLKVEPRCTTGVADAATFDAPAPIARTVVQGAVVTLGAVVLVLQIGDCDVQPCTCRP